MGFAIARLPFPDALAPSGLAQLGERGIAYRLWTTSPVTGDMQIIEASSVEPVSPVEAQVEVPNTDWTLSLSPIEGWGDPLGLGVRAGLGLLFSLLLATLAKMLADARTQKARLAIKVAERTAEVRAREADLERAEAIAQVGSWVFDIQSNKSTNSTVASRITGVPPDTPVRLESFLETVYPHDRAAVATAWQAALRGEPYDVEHRTLIDGKLRWLRQRAELEFDSDGRALRAVGTVEDITERKTAELALSDSEANLRRIVETAREGIWMIDAENRTTFVNPRMSELLGCPAEQMLGRPPFDFLDPEMRRLVERKLVERRQGNTDQYELRLTRLDGSQLWTLLSTNPLKDAAGRYIGTLGMLTDISARKQAEAELRIAAIAFEAQEGMLVTDAEERILRVNEAFTRITGYTAEEAVGQTPRLLHSGRHDPHFFAQMWAHIERNGYWEGEIWNRRKNGEVFPEWLAITAVRDDLGHVTHYVGTLNDISQRKEDEAAIRRLAFYDPLTGLANRRLLLDRLNQTLAAAARTGQDGALIFIDLDNFKQLNDTRGHHVGDLLLEEVAQRLTETVRKSDSVARLGGDEFVVLLQDLGEDPAQAAAMAEGVSEKIIAVLGMPYRLAGEEHTSTPSLGIAMFNREPHTAEEILKHADLAMYQAKAAGRNRLRFYDPKMQASVNQRAALERELRHAIGEGQLVLHYQSQVDGQGRVSGAEALLRWRHPERGLIPPAQFIGLAESLGLALPLGRWVLASACAQLAEWARRPETAGLTLAVNISGAHFRRPELVEDIRRALAENGANPKRLRLELAEATLLDDPDDSLEKMIALKETGVGFTLDNFGSGYCSLSYLKRLPLDQLKIAPAFVREVLEDCENDATADSFVALAESLGLALMAEGVETEAQRDYLAHHGCQIFQGFLFGLPGPPDALLPAGAQPPRRMEGEAGETS